LNKILIQIGAILNRNWSKFEPKLEQNLTIIRAYFKPKLDITWANWSSFKLLLNAKRQNVTRMFWFSP